MPPVTQLWEEVGFGFEVLWLFKSVVLCADIVRLMSGETFKDPK